MTKWIDSQVARIFLWPLGTSLHDNDNGLKDFQKKKILNENDTYV